MAVAPFQLPIPLNQNTPASAAAVTADIIAAATYGAQATNTTLSPQAQAALAALGVSAATADAAIIQLVAIIADLQPTPPPPSGNDLNLNSGSTTLAALGI